MTLYSLNQGRVGYFECEKINLVGIYVYHWLAVKSGASYLNLSQPVLSHLKKGDAYFFV